jgi:hypothetical protein
VRAAELLRSLIDAANLTNNGELTPGLTCRPTTECKLHKERQLGCRASECPGVSSTDELGGFVGFYPFDNIVIRLEFKIPHACAGKCDGIARER